MTAATEAWQSASREIEEALREGPLARMTSRAGEPLRRLEILLGVDKLEMRGVSWPQWAREHDFPPAVVRRVVLGRSPAVRGVPFRVSEELRKAGLEGAYRPLFYDIRDWAGWVTELAARRVERFDELCAESDPGLRGRGLDMGDPSTREVWKAGYFHALVHDRLFAALSVDGGEDLDNDPKEERAAA